MIIFFSCSDFVYNEDVVNENLEIGAKTEDFISLEEASEIATLFMNNKLSNFTRSGNSIRDTGIIQKEDAVGNILMYVINYQDGFALISATKKLFPILAYSETGNFDEKESGNIGLSLWMEMTMKEINDLITDTTRNTSDFNIMYAHLKEDLRKESESQTRYNETITNYQKVGPLLKTAWYQGPPYNNKAPLREGSKYHNGRAPAGCVPIAIAQVVNFYKRLDNNSIDWHGIDNGNDADLSELPFVIGNGIKMTYTKDYAHPQISFPDFFSYRGRIVKYLDECGYRVNFVEDSSLSKHGGQVPFMVEGFTENFIGGTNWLNAHWWVCDGFEKYDVSGGSGEYPLRSVAAESTKSEYYSYTIHRLHFNWGWYNGANNGWFGCSSKYLDYSKQLRRITVAKK